MKVQDVNFDDSRNSDEINTGSAGGGGSGGGGGGAGGPAGAAAASGGNRHAASTASELIASRALFTYNLAVAFLVRGEVDRAGEMLDSLAAQGNQHKVRERGGHDRG